MPDRTWHAEEASAVLRDLETSTGGLSEEEARRRLEAHGPNTLSTGDLVSPVRILLDQFRSPLIYVLVVALVITVAIDHYADAAVIALVLTRPVDRGGDLRVLPARTRRTHHPEGGPQRPVTGTPPHVLRPP